MVNIEDINSFCGPLKTILERELCAGNQIKETWQGGWPYPNVTAISLSKSFQTPIAKNFENVIYRETNDIHSWKAEYLDTKNNMMLVCGFLS